jgi:hypothetical protein
MAEEEEVDDTWFSLSLGGGRNRFDSALPQSIPSSSAREVYGPPPKARGGLDTISSTGLSWLSDDPFRVYWLVFSRNDVDLNVTYIPKIALQSIWSGGFFGLLLI